MSIFNARGLTNLITDVRACASKELEQRRVDKELAKIRNKFTQLNVLNSYDKRKYVWKLLYIFMLGYEIDFGHLQVINLLSSIKYAEKSIGYIGTSLLLKSSDELMTLVINSIRNDLVSSVSANQCLALSCLANIGGNELSEALSADVVRTLMSPNSTSSVKKKAALCLCRMLQTNPDIITPQELQPHLIALLEEKHLGVVTAVASLALKVVVHNPSGYMNLPNNVALKMASLVMHKACPNEYIYYTMPSPWIQVKLLRILQQFSFPEDNTVRTKLLETLKKILSRPEATKTAKNNAVYAVLFEATNLVIHYGPDVDLRLFDQTVVLLGKFLSVQEPNIRYIALETMARLAHIDGTRDSIKKHQDIVLTSLKDADISVRRRALDLLFVMCDHENALTIVEEMVNYLAIADMAIREAMVLKIAILAEQFAKDLRWYVDTVLRLISLAGSVVSDDIWHRVVQIITNKDDLQKYAAEMMFQALEPQRVHETTIKVGAYVLGEFGYLLSEQDATSGEKQFELLVRHKKNCGMDTMALILTALIKMAHLYEHLRPRIMAVLEKSKSHVDLEIQQRSCEYFALTSVGDDIMAKVLEAVPVFPEGRESALLTRLKSQSFKDEERKLDDANCSAQHQVKSKSPAIEDSSNANAPEEDLLNLNGDSNKSKNQEREVTAQPEIQRSPSPVDGLSSASPPPAPMDNEQTKIAALREFFKKALRKNQGVLFEDSAIQIGIKQEFRGSQGRLNLFFGNKSSAAITNFSAVIAPMSQVRFQPQSPPSSIQPAEQAKIQVMVECLQPFVDAPQITVSYISAERQVKHALRLPVVATSFIEAVPLNADDFKKRWTALEGNDREQQIVFNPSKPIDMDDNKTLLTADIHFAIAEGLDSSENTISAAGTFRTGSVTATGDKISVGCLMRLEANQQAKAYRLTVRAVHGDVSTAVKNVLLQLLS